jgi:hypothetical protein
MMMMITKTAVVAAPRLLVGVVGWFCSTHVSPKVEGGTWGLRQSQHRIVDCSILAVVTYNRISCHILFVT